MGILDRTPIPNKVLKGLIDDLGVKDGLKTWWWKFYLRKNRSIDSVNFFERDWDVLIILDACRLDLMREVAPEYEYIDTIDSVNSTGTATHQWMPAAFESASPELLAETAYITANPFSDEFLSETTLAVLDEVWQYAWNDQVGTVLPRPVTDRAISVGREMGPERMVVHYIQPHVPFVNSTESPAFNRKDFTSGQPFKNDWELLRDGERSFDAVWSDYEDNLRLVLDNLKILLQSIDAERVVITSDHGNAIGEYGLYGHPGNVSLFCLYEVP